MSTAKKSDAKAKSARREMTVQNRLGIHARPAAMFVKTTTKFPCEVFVERDGERVNGKSIMGVMMLAAGPGSKIDVIAEGANAEELLDAVEALLAAKFGED